MRRPSRRQSRRLLRDSVDMPEPIRSAVVVGGGSAGFLVALTFRRMLPQVKLTVVHSPDIPIIGVGESTTPAVPVHLHEHLGIDRNEFHREVRPSWKLGLRFEWGARDVPHFNYTFDKYLDQRIEGLSRWNAFYCLHDMRDASTFNAIMDRDRSPANIRNGRLSLDPRATYHIPNASFINYLERKSVASGAELIADQVVSVERNESGGVNSLKLAGGRELEADLFVDCSGFGSLLLGADPGGALHLLPRRALLRPRSGRLLVARRLPRGRHDPALHNDDHNEARLVLAH